MSNPAESETAREVRHFGGSGIFDYGIKDEDAIRLNNVNAARCLCGYCVPMSTHFESVCCRGIAGVQHRMPDRAVRCLHEP